MKTKLQLIALLGLIIFASGCSFYADPDLRIFVSANTNGIFRPCDCEVGPMGGLAKRARIMTKEDPARKALRIEAGGIVDELTDSTHYGSILEAYNFMRYDIILPGSNDELLLDWAIELKKKGWIGTRDQRIIKKNDLVINVTTFGPEEFGIGYETVELAESRQSGLDAKDADIIIWVTYVDEDRLEQLVNNHQSPDLILAGNTDYANPEIEFIKDIPVLRPGVDGMDLLDIKLNYKNDGWDIKPKWHTNTQKCPDNASWKIIRYHRGEWSNDNFLQYAYISKR